MPLFHSKSKAAFKHNVKAEVESGKPLPQSLAIAYSIKRKGKKMAEGGEVEHEEHDIYSMAKKQHEKQEIEKLEEHGMHKSMIDHIMKKRKMSKGGEVANEDHIVADNEMNEFDELAKDDELESHIHSDSEIGDSEHDKEERDMISQIMKNRKGKR